LPYSVFENEVSQVSQVSQSGNTPPIHLQGEMS
jgi:hypothetical protein